MGFPWFVYREEVEANVGLMFPSPRGIGNGQKNAPARSQKERKGNAGRWGNEKGLFTETSHHDSRSCRAPCLGGRLPVNLPRIYGRVVIYHLVCMT